MSNKPAETIRAEIEKLTNIDTAIGQENIHKEVVKVDKALEVITDIFEECLPAERVNQNETEQPYAAGQANGWNDAIQVIKRNFKRLLK